MANKIILPNGCSMSTPSVNPKEWQLGGVKLLERNWLIQYYFYSPYENQSKLIVVKGMNHIKNLRQRRVLTKKLIEAEIAKNKIGYNPVEKKFIRHGEVDAELHPCLNFISAFRIAITKIHCSKKHKKGMNLCVDRLEKKSVKLGLQNVTIETLKRRQLKQLLESCKLPNNYYNKFLSFLSRIFGELIEYECCESNIVTESILITKNIKQP